MSTWSLTGVAKAPDCDKVHQPLGSGGTSGAYATFSVAVGAPASTWPGSKRLLSTAHSSCIGTQPSGQGA